MGDVSPTKQSERAAEYELHHGTSPYHGEGEPINLHTTPPGGQHTVLHMTAYILSREHFLPRQKVY